jgi:hypothetical protein
VNTAIVGSNGVLNRVSEDGVLSAWFRQPHKRFGTSHRIINIVVALQVITIIISRGDVTFLANLYAFGVIWSFAMNGLAVLVLRYTSPGQREFQVPLNFTFRGVQIPLGRNLFRSALHCLHDFGTPGQTWRHSSRRDGSIQSRTGIGVDSRGRGRASR